jgi:hypothetical protein
VFKPVFQSPVSSNIIEPASSTKETVLALGMRASIDSEIGASFDSTEAFLAAIEGKDVDDDGFDSEGGLMGTSPSKAQEKGKEISGKPPLAIASRLGRDAVIRSQSHQDLQRLEREKEEVGIRSAMTITFLRTLTS